MKMIGVCVTSLCCICQKEEETTEHLFFGCEYSIRVLEYLSDWLQLNINSPNALSWILGYRCSRLQQRMLKVTLTACVYCIWYQRNNSRLECSLQKPETVALDIKKTIKSRCLPQISYPVRNKDAQWLAKITQG
ncbi:uncharacterized protein LOC141632344 [Silene latifolia]|uniref:uncharacterized protein LOC141632344 n=1 Tax=Silene latifolia TaxID=37657 RepID=UPI003D77473B